MMGRILLFVSSYAPLFLIATIRFHNAAVAISCAVLAFVGFAFVALLVIIARRLEPRHSVLMSIEDQSPDAAAYLAAYLLPFVTVTEPSWRDVVGYIVFLIVAGRIALVARLELLNPTLYIFGFRVARAQFATGQPGWVMTSGELPFAEGGRPEVTVVPLLPSLGLFLVPQP